MVSEIEEVYQQYYLPLVSMLEPYKLNSESPLQTLQRLLLDSKKQQHLANEWADIATSGLQWLRNIQDGISKPQAAIENMEVLVRNLRTSMDSPISVDYSPIEMRVLSVFKKLPVESRPDSQVG